MILDVGEKVHVIERRSFAEDLCRHFVGQIIRCSENAFRAKGNVWVYDYTKGQFLCKPAVRERVINFRGDILTINVIPNEVNLGELKYVITQDKGTIVTDGKGFSLDITDFSAIG